MADVFLIVKRTFGE